MLVFSGFPYFDRYFIKFSLVLSFCVYEDTDINSNSNFVNIFLSFQCSQSHSNKQMRTWEV